MNDLPLEVIIEKNKLASTGAWTLLLEVIPKEASLPREYYIRDTLDLTYNGQVYTAASFDLDSTKETAEGEIPSSTLTVYDPALALRPLLESIGGGVGSQVILTPVNTALADRDFSSLAKTYKIDGCHDDAEVVSWSLGGPGRLKARVPMDTFAAEFCRFHYGLASDGYIGCAVTPFAIEAVGLPGGSPVTIQLTGHPFETSDSVILSDITGITPSLDETWPVTVVDASTLSLDGTDGNNYSGSFSSGSIRFARCQRILSACRLRANASRFGGQPGMKPRTLRLA